MSLKWHLYYILDYLYLHRSFSWLSILSVVSFFLSLYCITPITTTLYKTFFFFLIGQGDTPLFPLFSIFLTSLKQLFFQVNSMVILKIAKSPIGIALNQIIFQKKSNMSITFCYLIYKVKAIEIKSMKPRPTHCTARWMHWVPRGLPGVHAFPAPGPPDPTSRSPQAVFHCNSWDFVVGRKKAKMLFQ